MSTDVSPRRRSTTLAALLAAICLLAPTGNASATSVDYYTHNGSMMTLAVAGIHASIVYHQPRAGLAGIGVTPGTVLFRGTLRSGALRGTAFTFRRGCPPAPYDVRGRISPNGTMVLEGAAPVWGAGCRIDGLSPNSPHARLVFQFHSESGDEN